MILKGNQRGGARQLARHLLNAQENDHVEIYEISGFMADDVMGAFDEAHAISRGTKCKQFLFSVSLNPPQNADVPPEHFLHAIEKIEAELKLKGQPRVIVFHEKEGRRHAHCVWSRIDVETHKAINLPHYKRKLNAISKQLFLHHGWELPKGYQDKQHTNPLNLTREEWQQAKRAMDDPVLMKQLFKEAWVRSDNRQSFEQALREHGLFLARGDKRGFVAMDMNGTPYSLSRWTGAKTKELNAKLGDAKDLPSLEEVKQRISEMLPPKVQDAITQQKADMALHVQKRQRTQAELIDIITYQHAAFNRRMMERSLYRHFDSPEAMRTAITDLITSGKLAALGERNGQMFYTTKEMQELERQLVQRAESMAGKRSHGLREATIKESVTAFNHQLAQETGGKARLTDNQLTAITHMTKDAQLASLVGVAGAGKTTIMQVVKDAYERQGYRVRGAALSGIAAGGLKESGIQAGTLHALEFQIKAAENMKRQQSWDSLSKKQQAFIKNTLLTKHDVLIIDEAGMVGTRQLALVMERAQKAGAKVILCGDHEQLQSIEAGAAFRTVVERTDYADITEVRRQKTDWMREATVQFAKGDAAGALSRYAENSHLHHAKDKETALSDLVADYMHSCQQNLDQSRMVLAYTRKDVTALNKAIKAEMVKAGKVSQHNTDLTIITQQDEQETQGFAKGDRIMFRENNRDLGVMNGTLATIAKIHGHIVDVRLDNGQDLRFNAKDYSKFQLGYAATVHKSQGVTVDEAFVLATLHFDRHTTYVAMTRHRHDVRLYAGKDDFRSTVKLIDSLSKDGRNISSLDFAAPAPSQMGKRKQSLLAHKRALTRHQRKEREALAEQQKQRRIQEHAAHKAMQPRGLKAVWQRVTGQDKQLRERIKQGIANRRSRETQENQALIQRQLKERQKLQQDITAFRMQARQELLQMRQNVGKAMETGKMPEYLAPQTPEMQPTQQQRPEMGM